MRSPLLLALALAACAHTPTEIGRIDADPFTARELDPLFAPLDIEWTPPADVAAEPFVLDERVLIPSTEIVSLDLRGAPLANAIHMVAEIAGINIYLDAEHGQLIDASFPSIRLDEALEVILEQNGLMLDQVGEGVYYVRESSPDTPTTARFPLTGGRAADILVGLQEFLGDGAQLVADPLQNVVVMHGTRAEVERAAELVAAFDRRRPQVLVEVGIFEASIDERFELGVSHNFSEVNDGDAFNILQAFTTPDDQFSMTFADGDGDLTSTIQALRRHVGLELISSPRVLTTTGTLATVEVVEEVPYVNVTSTTSGTTGGVGSTVQEEVLFKEVGITMQVTPVIQADGLIDIKIEQSVSEVVEFFNEIPVIDKRYLATEFLVADGQTAVLGGLMQDRRSDTDDGVPLLGDIPFLGALFGKDVDSTTKRELLVFLTPRVLDPLQAARVAELYRERYREARGELGLRRIDELPFGGE